MDLGLLGRGFVLGFAIAVVAGTFLLARPVAVFVALARDFSDPVSRTLAARCQELLHAPPPDWQGIYKLEAK